MPQDVFLRYDPQQHRPAEEGIPDEEILRVCRYVNADKFIAKLDHGLDEEVRERGNNFSAGRAAAAELCADDSAQAQCLDSGRSTANIDTRRPRS